MHIPFPAAAGRYTIMARHSPMSEHAPANEDSATRSGLPWPEAYGDLLPAMQQEWGIDNAIYLTSRSSGKSGARVFAVDIVSREFANSRRIQIS